MTRRQAVASVTTAAALGSFLGAEVVSAGLLGILLLLILVGACAALAIRRHGTILHPCLLIGCVFVANGVLGYLVYPTVRTHGTIANRFLFTEPERAATLRVFLLFGLVLLAIAAIAPRAVVASGKFRVDVAHAAPAISRVLLLFIVGVAASLFLGSNIPALFQRDSYQGFADFSEGGIPELFRLGDGLHVPAMLGGCVLLFSAGALRWERRVAWGALAVFVFMDFATASRALGLLPLVALVAYRLARGRVPGIRLVMVAVTISIVSFSAAIYLRGVDDQGVLAYVPLLVSDPQGVFLSRLPDIVASVLVGFPTAAYAITGVQDISVTQLWASINPLLSRQTGYDTGDLGLQIVDYIPYSAVGMLGRMGVAVGIGYYAAIGAILATLWWWSHRTSERAVLLRPVLVGTSLVIALMSVQYALRTTSRLTMVMLVGVPLLILGSSLLRVRGTDVERPGDEVGRRNVVAR